jgi:hypothetical protein
MSDNITAAEARALARAHDDPDAEPLEEERARICTAIRRAATRDRVSIFVVQPSLELCEWLDLKGYTVTDGTYGGRLGVIVAWRRSARLIRPRGSVT